MGSRSRPGSSGPRPRVVVVGGRRTLCVDQRWWPLLDALRRQQGIDRVWHGARGGADAGVAAWARARGLVVEEFPAPRSLYVEHGLPEHEADGRRNDDMLRAWGGYRSRGGSIVPCARAGGFADLVLALPPDDDTHDLVTRAERWSSLEVIRLWSPCHRWRMWRRGVEATMLTWGDVAVEADTPLRWGVGRTRAQLRGALRHQGWIITGREPAAEPARVEPEHRAKSA